MSKITVNSLIKFFPHFCFIVSKIQGCSRKSEAGIMKNILPIVQGKKGKERVIHLSQNHDCSYHVTKWNQSNLYLKSDFSTARSKLRYFIKLFHIIHVLGTA